MAVAGEVVPAGLDSGLTAAATVDVTTWGYAGTGVSV